MRFSAVIHRIVFLLLLFMLCINSEGAFLRYVPQKLAQPDGTDIELYASGDEYHNWLHDAQGYTVMRHPETGMLVYAVECAEGITASHYVAGKSDPSALGIKKWLNISTEDYKKKRENYDVYARAEIKSPSQGTLNNIVIFIRFADQEEFDRENAFYENIFNPGSPVSMYSYFLEVSYNMLSVVSHFYPVSPGDTVISWQSPRPRGYYSPYDSATNPDGYRYDWERGLRESGLLKDAINAVKSQIPPDLCVDGDDDGYVDNVCFIVRGNPDGWNELLWPHKGSLALYFVYINDKRVYTYNLNMESHTTSARTIAHEMFHSLGAKDLYHYNGGGMTSVGTWDIMDMNTNPPQHMGAYMKYRYGHWIQDIPIITFSGSYSLNPLTEQENNAYRINTPASDDEYFIVEHRRKEGAFESSLPGTGLLIYRINTGQDGEGNSYGPPDEVYIFRPDGTIDNNGYIFNAHYHNEEGRTRINDSTNPCSFLSDGTPAGLEIDKIEERDQKMHFIVNIRHPNIRTDSAENITADSAVLCATANARGYDSSVYFQYGTSSSYGSTTGAQAIGAGDSDISVESDITGLSLDIEYHYRAVITSSYGTVYGEDMTFTAWQCPAPEIITLPATDEGNEEALLNALANPMGCLADVWFEWGEDAGYGSQSPSFNIGDGLDDIVHSFALTGLQAGTEYHYRAVISSEGGTVYGGDQSFVTGSHRDKAVISISSPVTRIELWDFDESLVSSVLYEGNYADILLSGDITGDGTNEIIAYFYGYGIYYYDFISWKPIISIHADILRTAKRPGSDILILSIPGYGLYSWEHTDKGGIWQRILGVTPAVLETLDSDNDGYDELFAGFAQYGSYLFDFTDNSFTRLLSLCPGSAASISVNQGQTVAGEFYPYGIYVLEGDLSWKPLLNTGLDEGYSLFSCDIEKDSQDELFGCFYQTAYFHSFQDDAWKPLSVNCYDITATGHYTGQHKEDILFYSSSERLLRLYKASSGEIETLVQDIDIIDICTYF